MGYKIDVAIKHLTRVAGDGDFAIDNARPIRNSCGGSSGESNCVEILVSARLTLSSFAAHTVKHELAVQGGYSCAKQTISMLKPREETGYHRVRRKGQASACVIHWVRLSM